jgi:PAS domain S-box-containing protein
LAEALGTTLAELGRTGIEPFLNDPVADLQRLLSMTALDESIVNHMHTLRSAQGGRAAFFVTGSRISVPTVGACVALSMQDISATMPFIDKQRAEVALLATIVDGANAAIISVDQTGIINRFNKRAEALLGYSADELVGKQTPEIFHVHAEVVARAEELSRAIGRPVKPTLADFIAHARKGFVDEREWTYVHRDGRTIPVLLSITPQYDEAGAIAGMLGVALDITERVRARNETLRHKHEAEEASRAKGMLVACMTHELRNPVHAAMGMTTLLLESQLTVDQRSCVETIRLSASQQLEVINAMLDFSKIEAGHVQLQKQPFLLRRCIDESVELLGHAARAKGLEIAVFVDRDCPKRVLGDVSRLRQILVNLLGNAVKFSDEGAISVHASTSIAEHGISFRVTDQGVGIKPAHMGKIFAPFGVTPGARGGTGLGLAISQRLARALGGDMCAESELGKGSSFIFDVQPPAAQRQRERSAAATLFGRRPMPAARQLSL